jgi:copper homeostasis protein
MKVEIAANNIASAISAYEGGAHRIELVSNLAEGGTTPSAGTLDYCIKNIPIDCFPIIRTRGGDFLYDIADVATMQYDIALFRDMGCKGIVIGALTADGDVDVPICKSLISQAGDMQITFHRAFDRAKNALESVQKIIDLGCHRILTSGQFSNAYDGRFFIKELIEKTNNQIIIMPGAGVTAANAKEIIDICHATEIHASMKDTSISKMNYFSTHFQKETYMATSTALVKELVASATSA